MLNKFQSLKVILYLTSGWLAWEMSKLTLNTLVELSVNWAAQLPKSQAVVMFPLIVGIALLICWMWIGIFSASSFCIKKLDRKFRSVNKI